MLALLRIWLLNVRQIFEQGANVAARKSLEAIQVKLGGGITRLPLSRLIPPNQFFDLEEILEPYCR